LAKDNQSKEGETTNQNLLPRGSLKLGEEEVDEEEPPIVLLLSLILPLVDFTNILKSSSLHESVLRRVSWLTV